MNILFNARVLNEQRGGPARYTLNAIRKLGMIDKRKTYHVLKYSKLDPGFPLPANFITKEFRTKSRLLFDYLLLPLYSRHHKIGISLYTKNPYSPLVGGKKLPFCNDIVYFKKLGFREFKFFKNLHHTIMVPIAGRFSFLNLAISEFTALHKKEPRGIGSEEIRILRPGIEKSFRLITSKQQLNTVIEKHGLRRPFFFYAESLSTRKNMPRVLRAFIKIKDRVPHGIYFTAGDLWHDEEVTRIIDENGLPILEAQACGCPAITSRVSSCPEVAGDSALIVHPYDVDNIATTMERLARDKAFRKKLIMKGFKNYARYSWKKTTRELLQVLRETGAE